MSDGKNKTTRVFVAGEGPDPVRLQTALAWLQNEASERGASGVIVVPQLDTADGLARFVEERGLKALRGGQSVTFGSAPVTLTTTRKLGSSLAGQVVLALYMPAKDLARLDDLFAAAICALPWISDDVAAWRQTWNPVDLTGSASPAPATMVLSPAVRGAIKAVGLLTKSISSSSDRSNAVWAFRLLRGAGESFDAASVRAYAVQTGWQVRHADELAAVADAIAKGKALKADATCPWKPDIVEQWRSL